MTGENDRLQSGIELGLVTGNELPRWGRGKDRIGFGGGRPGRSLRSGITWHTLRPGRTIRTLNSDFSWRTFPALCSLNTWRSRVALGTLNSRYSLSTWRSLRPSRTDRNNIDQVFEAVELVTEFEGGGFGMIHGQGRIKGHGVPPEVDRTDFGISARPPQAGNPLLGPAPGISNRLPGKCRSVGVRNCLNG